MSKRQKAPGKRWTHVEVEYLHESYTSKSLGEMTNALRRTDVDVRRMLKICALPIMVKIGNKNIIRNWTDEEDQYLQDNFANATMKQLAKSLNRSYASIKGRAQKFKLVKTVDELKSASYNCWTAEADQYIIDNPSSSYAELSDHLNRSTAAVVKRCGFLGIDTTNKRIKANPTAPALKDLHFYGRDWSTKEEEAFLRENYGTCSNPELAKKMNRPRQFVTRIASKLGLRFTEEQHNKRLRRSWTAEEERFIIANWQTMSLNQMRSRLNVHQTLLVKKAEVLGLPEYRPFTKQWTLEEEAYLLELIKQKSKAEIATILNRTSRAIEHRLLILIERQKNTEVNVQIQKTRSLSTQWTEGEIQYIRENWQLKTTLQIASELGRTLCAVKSRARMLNLRKGEESRKRQYSTIDQMPDAYVLNTFGPNVAVKETIRDNPDLHVLIQVQRAKLALTSKIKQL